MSHDVCVWYPDRRLPKDEAASLFLRLIEGDTGGVVAHPSINAFHDELVAIYPPIDLEAENDDSPWATEFERSPGHLLMTVSWSRAEEVFDVICQIARKHGLAVIETERETPLYPDDHIEPE
jgi:hypothetical protein